MEFINGWKKGQKKFGSLIAVIINLIALSIVYFAGVGLTSLTAKIFRKHFMDLEIKKDKKSYWKELNLEKKKMEEYYRQF